MDKTITCIICPRGCSIRVQGELPDLMVTGNSCPNGRQYAIDECTHPVRTLTSVVKVGNRPQTMVSVKTSQPIPKESMTDAMNVIHKLSVSAPVQIGEVLYRNLFGADIIATKTVL